MATHRCPPHPPRPGASSRPALEQDATGDDRLPGNDADTHARRGPRPRPRPESLPCLVASFRRDSPAPIRASARSWRTATLAQRGCARLAYQQWPRSVTHSRAAPAIGSPTSCHRNCFDERPSSWPYSPLLCLPRAQSAMRFRISAGPRATIRSPGAKRTSWSGFAETSLPGFFSARMATPA